MDETFRAEKREIAAALLMYPLAYLYAWNIWMQSDEKHGPWLFLLFTAGFIALAEWRFWERKRSAESIMLLASLCIITLCDCLGPCRVWSQGEPFLFMHILAVWWVLSRSGCLLEGTSGHLLPLDALNGFIVFPFSHFFLRLRCWGWALASLGKKERKKEEKDAGNAKLWTVLGILAALFLFVKAAKLLTQADSGFEKLLYRFKGIFSFDFSGDFVAALLLSLPVGAYLFGLIGGAGRESIPQLREKGERITAGLDRLCQTPNRIWELLLFCFGILYLLFFIVQGRYLFGAFAGVLPEGFTVSAYARQGFFELCRVMVLNFLLLWLVVRLARVRVRERRLSKAAVMVILFESLLLAATAFSKIALYIDCFGFTPRRIQSAWLVAVLGMGCVFALRSLVRGEKCLKVWIWFGVISLTLTHLY